MQLQVAAGLWEGVPVKPSSAHSRSGSAASLDARPLVAGSLASRNESTWSSFRVSLRTAMACSNGIAL